MITLCAIDQGGMMSTNAEPGSPHVDEKGSAVKPGVRMEARHLPRGHAVEAGPPGLDAEMTALPSSGTTTIGERRVCVRGDMASNDGSGRPVGGIADTPDGPRTYSRAAPEDIVHLDVSGRVIAGFPAVGKSHLAANAIGVTDSDSSAFSWAHIDGEKVRHPDWPANYIDHIRGNLADGFDVLVSTHAEVRAALTDAGIPFILVYPHRHLRDEYRARMERRGSPDWLIAKVCDELWEEAWAGCRRQQGCLHFALDSGEYLSDVWSDL